MNHEYIKNVVKKNTQSILKEVIEIRRWIHQHPELSFNEKNTSSYVCSVLKKYNIPFENNIGGDGVVALIQCRNPQSQVIGIRADMDALPIQEKNEISYKSINKGVMHACGHDVHTAIALGVAIVLNSLKGKLFGTIKLIFQPAEEKLPGGASIMIKDGVLMNPKIDKMFALHVYPEFEVGYVGFRSGQYMAACDELYITIKGKGGHAALPEKVNNPITAAAETILLIKKNILDFAKKLNSNKYVLEFGDFHAYGASNVIPEKAFLQGTLRTLDEHFRNEVHKLLIEQTKQIENKYSISCNLEIKKGYPTLYNDPTLTEKCKIISRYFLDTDSVRDLDIRMASEDFSYFSQECPSCFFRLGVANKKKGITHLVHTPNFNIDEKSLELGVGLMSYIVISNLLNLRII
ncbi:MAG: N-acyl-L-amino acid amidohydrolase [Flavobacteriales bacterium]|nr:N-acyl-L-amino acid amidohydrolase [Flavobacteriales bacterium]